MKFSEVFKNLRKEKGLTQVEMAKELGISRSAIGMYEQGKREPDFETEEKIADYFNVTLDYLRTGNSAPSTGWYLDPETARLAQDAFQNPQLRLLMDSSRSLSPDDIKILVDMATRMKGTNHDG